MIDPELETLLRIGVAAGVGLAIGLERGWKELAGGEDSPSSAGIRTFTIVGLLGGLCGWLHTTMDVPAIVPGFVVVIVLVAAGYALTTWRGGGAGLTTEFALVVTYTLGVTAGVGEWPMATGIAVVVALVLSLKTEIHAAVRHLDRQELLSTLQLLVLAVLVVPMLPNRDVLGLEGLNPRTIGLLALLIALVSYVGYFSVQSLGARAGLLLTAALGGLTSSTAVTVSYARMARRRDPASPELGIGIALACSIMAPRLIVMIGIIAPSLVPPLLLPFGILFLVPLAAAALSFKRHSRQTANAELNLTNPLAIRTALAFAGALAVLFVLVPVVRDAIGAGGLYTLAGLSGLTDADAVTLSMARNAGEGQLDRHVAMLGITVAAVANTLTKAALCWTGSGGRLKFWAGMLIGAGAGAVIAAAAMVLSSRA